VPRYFFHFSDGSRQFSDDTGQELSGLRAARGHATQQVRELKAAMCDQVIQDLSAWSMSVADARGRTVFVLGFDLTPRPIVPLAPTGPHEAPAPSSRPARLHADTPRARSSVAGTAAKD
jgi:hypothetical protein